MSNEKKEFFIRKGTTELKVFKKEDTFINFLERMGLRES